MSDDRDESIPDDPDDSQSRYPEEAEEASPFGEARLEFPIAFDLRIIYVLARGATIQPDLERIFRELEVPCSLMQGLAAPGAKYGRWGCRITLESRKQMYALYAEIGKLEYVKAAI